MALGVGIVSAQDYPNRPIHIFAGPPGGAGDTTLRFIAQGLTANLGQQVIVDNRGGTVSILAQLVMNAPADGYTLLFQGNPLWLFPLMQDRLSYEAARDFSPITLTVSSPNVLVVHPSLPVKSVKDLIALAKAKPKALNYGSGMPGGSPHLSAELFKLMAGVNIVHVPYKGVGPSISALIAGETQLMFASAMAVTPHVKSGRLRALAVTSATPSALAPGLPTLAASGLPGYESSLILGIFAPIKTPNSLINRLNQEIVRVLSKPEVKAKLFSTGAEVVASSPEQLAVAIKSDIVTMGRVIKEAGIHAD